MEKYDKKSCGDSLKWSGDDHDLSEWVHKIEAACSMITIISIGAVISILNALLQNKCLIL